MNLCVFVVVGLPLLVCILSVGTAEGGGFGGFFKRKNDGKAGSNGEDEKRMTRPTLMFGGLFSRKTKGPNDGEDFFGRMFTSFTSSIGELLQKINPFKNILGGPRYKKDPRNEEVKKRARNKHQFFDDLKTNMKETPSSPAKEEKGKE